MINDLISVEINGHIYWVDDEVVLTFGDEADAGEYLLTIQSITTELVHFRSMGYSYPHKYHSDNKNKLINIRPLDSKYKTEVLIRTNAPDVMDYRFKVNTNTQWMDPNDILNKSFGGNTYENNYIEEIDIKEYV